MQVSCVGFLCATLITRQPALLSSVILTSAARKNLLVPSFLIERIAKSAKQMLHFVQHDIQKSELKRHSSMKLLKVSQHCEAGTVIFSKMETSSLKLRDNGNYGLAQRLRIVLMRKQNS